MGKHKWTFITLGGVPRVSIHSGEDIRHIGELDKKMWTVLSCPTTGLEISEESLRLIDLDGDGKLRVKEVVATAEWLCSVLRTPDVLLQSADTLAVADIQDGELSALAQQIAQEKDSIAISDIDNAIANIKVDIQPIPNAPYPANVITAYKNQSATYAAYFEQEKLQKLGLFSIPEDTPKPGMTEKKFLEMGAQIAAWEEEKAAIETANTAAKVAAQAAFMPLRKLLLLNRDFYRLLRNFISFEDFYNKKSIASFQCGTLIIDQRACHLCIRVSDMPKHNTQAPQSGIFLVYCDCESKKLGTKMQIVAAVTVGEVKNLCVGKNAVFYDNVGNDYDATVTKVIDNPISIAQAFWTPYRKLGNWITDKINKSAAEKDAKVMTNVTTNMETKAAAGVDTTAKPAFDIAKFAGIFAAIGMAVGMIGTALAALASEFVSLTWWQMILVFVGLLVLISGPSMVIAWLKLRRRNLAPVLNANGWAINADAVISVFFGSTLTEQVKYPMVKDPLAKQKKNMKTWQAVMLTILCFLVIGCGVYGVCTYLQSSNVEEQSAVSELKTDTVVVVEEGINE